MLDSLPALPAQPADQALLSVADRALAKIVDLLHPAGYGFTIPAWDGDAYCGSTTRSARSRT